MNELLKTEKLTFIYGEKTPFERTAVKEIDFEIDVGELVGIIGHTGSGKSTLIQHFNGLLKPASGRVLFDGKDIWDDPKKIRDIRFQVGLVFQYPEYQLFEETIAEDIAFGPKNMGLGEAEVRERMHEAMDFVGLPRSLSDKSPFDLSGGQKRRVAIAGVIAMRPKVLVLDEPTAGLDPAGRNDILEHIKQYRSTTGAAVVLVTHSMEDIARTADRLTVLSDARVVMSGSMSEVFSHAESLERIGLSIPSVSRVLLRLKAMGLDGLNTGLYTVEDAARELRRLKEALHA